MMLIDGDRLKDELEQEVRTYTSALGQTLKDTEHYFLLGKRAEAESTLYKIGLAKAITLFDDNKLKEWLEERITIWSDYLEHIPQYCPVTRGRTIARINGYKEMLEKLESLKV